MEFVDKIAGVQSAAIIIISVVISIIDIKTYRIPDLLVAVLFFFLVVFDFLNGYSFVLHGLLSGAVVFAMFFAVFYFVGSMGFGDVKFAAVLSYGLGFMGIYIAMLFATVSGLLLFLAGKYLWGWNRGTKLPFAPFLSGGAIFSIVIRRLCSL